MFTMISVSVETRSTENNQIQYENDITSFLIKNESILRQGFVYKKKGLFPRRRFFVLTNTPRLIYIDPTTNIQKGEIVCKNITRCEARNFRQFFVHTVSSKFLRYVVHDLVHFLFSLTFFGPLQPNRIYNLEDTSGGALDWCESIDRARAGMNQNSSSH